MRGFINKCWVIGVYRIHESAIAKGAINFVVLVNILIVYQ